MDSKLLGTVLLVALLTGALTWYFWPRGYTAPDIELAELGLGLETEDKPASESQTREGFSYKNANGNDIAIELPFPHALTGSDFSVRGKVRSGWLEGKTLTIFVYDQNSNEIAVAAAPVERSLSFKGDISIANGYRGLATVVVVRNDPNPSADVASLVSFPIEVSP